MDKYYDVVVVGAGNAALCAALAAQEQGVSVVVLERAPFAKRGGNSGFTGGGFRMVHHGLATIEQFVPDLSDDEKANTDFGEYTREQYLDDLGRVTQYHINPDLAEIVVDRSTDTVQWIRQKGIRFIPKYGRQAFKHQGRFKFFGGLVIQAVGGGRGLIEAEFKAVERFGIPVCYDTRAISLRRESAGISAVRAIADGREREIETRAVVLASGGFEANREWRTRYLGPGYDLAKVRGTRYNTGDGIQMALDVGAQSYGQWSGCHSVSWERYAADFGEVDAVGVSGQRHSYPFSIMVNSEGRRFLDEGADFRNFTYAKYGRVVLAQPGNFAWQVFDAQGIAFLREEYKLHGATKVRANTLEELVARMQDVEPEQFLTTVREFNAAVKRDVPFNPNIKDGRRTVGLAIDKTNWANPIENPPFEAYSVGTGVTFTFGGIKIDTTTHVLDISDQAIPGLYAAGELVGGLYYFNYPGSAGLMSGAVFGRMAGHEAGVHAKQLAGK
jgi:tricarballylate dehydrogenase